MLRNRLQKRADRLAAEVGPLGHRVFTDSAPVLEAELARRSGQGWRGKHTLILSREGGSMFSLGEIYIPHPGSSMRVAASRISPSNTTARFRWSCGR